MLRSPRAAVLIVLAIPVLATCGGTEPSGPEPAALQVVVAVPDSVRNRVFLTEHPAVRLVDAEGGALPEGGVIVTATSLTPGYVVIGRSTATTDANGIATFDSLSVRGLAGLFTLRFSVPGLPPLDAGGRVLIGGVPATISVDVTSGNAIAGSLVSPFSAIVRDSNNNLVAGTLIERTVLGGGGSVATLDTTGPNGIAQITDWRMGTTPALNRLRIAVAGRPGMFVEAQRQAEAGPPSQLSVTYAFPDSAVVGATVGTPFTVLVTDSFGNPDPGVEITFRGISPTGTVYGVGGTVLTNGVGTAQLATMNFSTLAGTHTFRVTASKFGVTIFRDTVLSIHPGPPYAIPVVYWEDVTVRTGDTVAEKVGVWDIHENLIPGAALHLGLTAGGGVVSPVDTVTPDSGWVHFRWVAGPPGRQTMEITTPGVQARTIGMNAADPRALALVEGGGARAGIVGQTLAAIVVSATDSAGGPVWHVPLKLLRNGVHVASGETDSTGTGRIGIPVGTVPGEFALALVSPWVPADTIRATLAAAAGPPDEIRLVRNLPVRVTEVVDTSITFAILDQFDNPLPGIAVTLAASAGVLDSTSTVSDSLGRVRVRGWHLPTTSGAAELAVTAGSLHVPFVIQIRPGPVALLTLQRTAAGFAGEPVGRAPRVRGVDQYGNFTAGDTITWTIVAGGGSVSPFGVLDAQGKIDVLTWTLGPTPGLNTLRGSIGGEEIDISTTSTAPSPFNIELRGNTSAYAWAFRTAAYEWRRRITADMPDLVINTPAGECGAYNGNVDDLVVDVMVTGIDGPGGILGSAGPCWYRTPALVPLLGRIRLDVADLVGLEEEGTLDDVAIHEMGHVLGIGTMWALRGLVTQSGTIAPQFTGPGGKQGWAEVGGLALGGPNVPLESDGGPGTAEAHWREIAMPSELMTGWLSSTVSPISAVTVRSLFDLGYIADPSTADPYTVLTAPAPAGPRIARRIRDIPLLPQGGIDAGGRIVVRH